MQDLFNDISKTDTKTETVDDAELDEEGTALFVDLFEMASTSVAPCNTVESASVAALAPELKLEEAAGADIDTCLKHAQKAHGEWDRQFREFRATSSRSKGCIKTNDMPIDREFDKLLESGTAADNILLAFEQKHRSNEEVTTEHVESCRKACEDIWTIAKQGSNLSNALKMLIAS